MGILLELKNRGIEVAKSNRLYRGYNMTPKGVVVSDRKCENEIHFLEGSNGKIFPCNETSVYIITGTKYEGKVYTKEELQKLVEQGEIFSFKSYELYSEYYDFPNNVELECCFKYGYSSRSRKYIEKVMNNIGLISYTDATNYGGGELGEPTEFDVLITFDDFLDADIQLGKIGNMWIAQTCYQYVIDDFAVIKMYFNRRPSSNDLKLAFAIRSFEQKPIEIFNCWECGHLTNWLDYDGDIKTKYDMAKEKYCGC
jgi:hypothetical protein